MVRGAPDWTRKVVVDVVAQVDPVPVAFEIEGDYETWEKLWDMAVPDGWYAFTRLTAILSEDYLYLCWMDSVGYKRFAIYKLQDGSQVFLSPSGAHYTDITPQEYDAGVPFYNAVVHEGNAPIFSIRGRYVFMPRAGATTWEVWKKGVKVWTTPDPATVITGATAWYLGGISFDGKWIILITDNAYICCYKGKP